MKFLNYMDYIYTVYKECSFTKAAEKLYISQPALSLTIKKIENDIGYPLFERCGREVKLTPVGESYIKAIEEINRITANLSNEVDDLLKLKKGSITIGSTTFIASYILPDVLKQFRREYPEVEVKIVVEQSTLLEQKLEADLVDFVVDNAITLQNGYNYNEILKESILLAVPSELDVNSPLERYAVPIQDIRDSQVNYDDFPRVDMAQFAKEKFILLKKGNKMRQIAHRIFEENSIDPSVVMEFDDLHTSFSYAERGFGICFLSNIAVKFSFACDHLRFYLPKTAHSARPLYVITKKSKYISSAARELIRFIKKGSAV